MGINENKIYCISFGISIALVGISGALLITYFSHISYRRAGVQLQVLHHCCPGGKGSVIGALLGGLIVGVIEKIGAQYLSESYAQVLVFLLFILILLFKPTGLLSKEKD